MTKKLKDMDYVDLIDKLTQHAIDGLTSGTPLRVIQHNAIDWTIAWLREKGKLDATE